MGPFLPNRRVTSGGAVLGQVSGVGMPFFYSVLVGKVWEIKGLCGIRTRSRGWAEFANFLLQLIVRNKSRKFRKSTIY